MATRRAAGQTDIPGGDAFFLHDTLGLPLEVTKDIAGEHGFTVDEPGYHAAREAQRARARAAGDFKVEDDSQARRYAELAAAVAAHHPEPLGYDPYGPLDVEAEVVGLLAGDTIELVLSRTGFYVESGGQVSDTGRILGPDWEVAVTEMLRPVEGLIVHSGRVVRGQPKVGDKVTAQVDAARRWDIRRNHTATHLLHRALRQVLGSHVAQAGSLVTPERLRFDYNFEKPMTPDQRAEIERLVTEAVLANYRVEPRQEAYRDALSQGVIALFGEKYGDVVRVLRVGEPEAPYSQELCGGTHVTRTGDIGPFLITAEGGIGAGIRRIEAVTGRGALQAIQTLRAQQEQAAALLNAPPEALSERVERLQAELKAAHKEIEALNRKLARESFQALLSEVVEIAGVPVLAARVDAPDADTLREMADWFRDKMRGGVIVLGTVIEDKPLLIAATTKEMNARGIHAGKIVKQVAQIVGGGGGGRPDMAQAGGRDAGKLDEALAAVVGLVGEMVKT